MVLRRKFNGAKVYTEAWDARKRVVEERRIRGEAVAEAAVDLIRVRMPE